MQENFSFDTSRSVLQRIVLPLFDAKGVEVYVKRDDLIHELVSGNKWRKLKYNLAQARQNKAEGIFTFGGAFSNHLLATASACREFGFRSIGFVRGEELNANSNETLRKCSGLGMELIFLDRMEYGMRNDQDYLKELKNGHPNFYAIPEGGANYYGVIGCQETWQEIPFPVDHVFVAQGTAATSCGLAAGNKGKAQIHVVPVLKGFDVVSEMKKILDQFTYDESLSEEYLQFIQIHGDCHFGGYAKYDEELLAFIRMVYRQGRIPLDHVYTGKAFYALYHWIESSDNLAGQKIVFLHTGGLQASDFYLSDSSQ
ncbi:MAG: 1-aminocyclopropane-1-carboxylate deaminase/D-cysteine desulfhydrase [Bacteroidota bacterium]